MANPTLRRWQGQAQLTGAATLAAIKVADDAASYIYVTKIRLNVCGHANGKKTIFQDSNGTPVIIAQFDDLTVASGTPGLSGTVVYDFGTRGYKLTLGKTFNVLGEASGTTGSVTAEGYQSAS